MQICVTTKYSPVSIFVDLIPLYYSDNPGLRMLWAAENDKLDIVQELTKTETSLVCTHDKDGYTPLHRAAYNNHLEVAQVIL